MGDGSGGETQVVQRKNIKRFFRFTVDYLQKTKKINNLLIVFSPDHNFESAEQYLARYPGDDYVDILGLDNYSDFKEQRLDRVV
jgi:mannan endo-1,4-beta-mannosidase